MIFYIKSNVLKIMIKFICEMTKVSRSLICGLEFESWECMCYMIKLYYYYDPSWFV